MNTELLNFVNNITANDSPRTVLLDWNTLLLNLTDNKSFWEKYYVSNECAVSFESQRLADTPETKDIEDSILNTLKAQIVKDLVSKGVDISNIKSLQSNSPPSNDTDNCKTVKTPAKKDKEPAKKEPKAKVVKNNKDPKDPKDEKEYDLTEIINKKRMKESEKTVAGIQQAYYHPLDESMYFDKFTNAQIMDIYNAIMNNKSIAQEMQEKMFLFMVCHMMMSKGYCHLILNNRDILNAMSMLEKYNTIIAAYLWYGFHLLYREELIIGVHTKNEHRFVYDLLTAQSLPRLPKYAIEKQYIPCAYKYDIKKTPMCPIAPPEFKFTRGLHDYIQFVRNVDTFTGGVLKGLDWSRICLTGSAMTACLIRNPVECLFLPSGQEYSTDKVDWDRYFDEFYPSNKSNPGHPSDIDLMIETVHGYGIGDDERKKSDEEYEAVIKELFTLIQNNLINAGVVMTAESLKLTKVNTKSSYRYKIEGTALKRSFEPFRVWSHAGTVAKFHVASVRAYAKLNNNTGDVHMFPSFITAAFTGVNPDHRWFSSNKTPADVFRIYQQRGFGMILNQHQVAQFVTFVKHTNKWKTSSDTLNDEEYIGPKSIYNRLYRPRVSNSGRYFEVQYQAPPNDITYVSAPISSKTINMQYSKKETVNFETLGLVPIDYLTAMI
jgi:hypothetical protein